MYLMYILVWIVQCSYLKCDSVLFYSLKRWYQAISDDNPSYLHSQFYVFRAQEPKAPVTYCDHALSGVRRPSVCRPSVRRPLDNLHFQLLLQNRFMDFDETW